MMVSGQPAESQLATPHMLPGDVQSCYLLLCKEVFDQGAHNLLWGPGCTDVGEDEVAMCLLSIADPA